MRVTKEIPENSPDIDRWIRLIRADGVGPVLFGKLLKFYGSVDAILGASASGLARVEGIGTKTAERIVSTRDKFDTCAELELAEKLGVWLIHMEDPRYPPLLKQIYDPPPVLYIKGTLGRQDNLSIAIVGSRHCSIYGTEQASRLAHLLAASGFTIVSGLARGIDTAAHHGALAAEGRSIAVQGCGLANVFPPENARLFELITQNGACISELPLQYEPLSENFPPRNRIIAGLSIGTIVVEAGLRSGALITAKTALESNREVMAVPGKVDSPLSKGPNQLIKEGAKLIESVEDVMEALGYVGEQLKEHTAQAAGAAAAKAETPLFETARYNLKGHEKQVYDSLGSEPLHTDQVIDRTDLSPGTVNATLMSLRLKGLIRQLPGNLFKRR
ncbi:MAG TPA: DNA-processing protein DprA [Sedimentisphaerales bacterium]|nr:DNA-processing protein DprA [Sedimentisphaerales bacterium]HRS11834.1 DNA-processing protein DprA [Sedimentisphaerales bacterium]HRV48757.1 DNA-processing protein DprA [Sedimentisphaerales bacterium]